MASESRARDAEIVDLVVAYARQETIEPLRGAGRWILWGVVSMCFLSLGVVMLTLGLLRAVQDLGDNAAFQGAWSFAPYLICTMLAAGVVGFAASRIRRTRL